MDKEYIKATIYTTTQGAEALAAVLPALGVDGFSVDDPRDFDLILAAKDELCWDFADIPSEKEAARETTAMFYLENTADAENALRAVREALFKLKADEQYGVYGEEADFGRLWLDTEVVKDDWKYKYKETFRTFSPCDGIVISPPWEDVTESGAPVHLVIDPGMAFGTGSHETTSMCLEKLTERLKAGDIMLDAGTGSGILAIAAAKLGASRVYAVEMDADAVASAMRNIEANGTGDTVLLITGDLTRAGVLPDGMVYDVITANLSCGVLKALLPVFREKLTADGVMILSGILDAQEEQAREIIEYADLKADEPTRKGEWLLFEARK